MYFSEIVLPADFPLSHPLARTLTHAHVNTHSPPFLCLLIFPLLSSTLHVDMTIISLTWTSITNGVENHRLEQMLRPPLAHLHRMSSVFDSKMSQSFQSFEPSRLGELMPEP